MLLSGLVLASGVTEHFTVFRQRAVMRCISVIVTVPTITQTFIFAPLILGQNVANGAFGPVAFGCQCSRQCIYIKR